MPAKGRQAAAQKLQHDLADQLFALGIGDYTVGTSPKHTHDPAVDACHQEKLQGARLLAVTTCDDVAELVLEVFRAHLKTRC